MKKIALTVSGTIFAAVFALAFIACPNTGMSEQSLMGSISGQITVDGYGEPGFIVSVAGTQFMAITDENGRFVIGGIPAGQYRLIVVRGNFIAFFAETVNVFEGRNTKLEDDKNITSTELSNTPPYFVPVEGVSLNDDSFYLFYRTKPNTYGNGSPV